MRLLLLLLLLAPAAAVEITLNAPGEIYAGETWTVDAYVTDGGSPVAYPNCNITVYRGSEPEVYRALMSAQSDRATYSITFYGAEDRSATVQCYGTPGSLAVTVKNNIFADLTVSGGDAIGETAYATVSLQDRSGNRVYADCTLKVLRDGTAVHDALMYSTASGYAGSYYVELPGTYTYRVTCTDSELGSVTESVIKEVEKVPVRVSISKTAYTGSYGATATIPVSVNPGSASCSADFGTVQGSGSYRAYTARLGFVGTRSVKISCSDPNYLTGEATLSLTSVEVSTLGKILVSTLEPYSFQRISIQPQYFTASWYQIRDADCTVEYGESVKGKSFQKMELRAPPGPATMDIDVECRKYGYKPFKEKVKLKVKPITLRGELSYREAIKENEPLNVRVSLEPGIEANCTFRSTLESEIATSSLPAQSRVITAEGNFSVIPGDIGTLRFSVECTGKGYTTFRGTGKVDVRLFSESEEISAAIVLTTLTAILAVAFLMIKRWL